MSTTAETERMEIHYWPLDKMKPYTKNPRKHDAAVPKMAKILSAYGAKYPLLIKSDGTIVDGHLRYKAAVHLGWTEMPVVLADNMTDEEIAAFRIAVNKSATFAEWDVGLLLGELNDLALGLETGFDIGEINVLEELNSAQMGEKKNTIQEVLEEDNFTKDIPIKVVLPCSILEVFEAAIIKTGLNNRADAVKAICEGYLGQKR